MTNLDPNLKRQVQRLYQLYVCARWLFVVGSWLTLGSLGIWGLREEIAFWREHFTWVAVRYAIAYNRIPSLCLAFCIGVTTAVLIWQTQTMFWGLSAEEKQRLERQAKRIHAIGPRHPLWKWINQ
ncbi:MAG: hypothetical protein MUD14_22630 [Hydrococcus sp. Prado102]|jgi:hypothetical protein|nr:hypothetical protein [Hydrococcus sp. Prado102]